MVHVVSRQQREKFFGAAVILAGCAISVLCLAPLLFPNVCPRLFLSTYEQEQFFFDLFGLISGCWLLCWISAVNQWKVVAKVGQWFGLVLLCLDQAILLLLWKSLIHYLALWSTTLWVAPLLVQLYLLGCFIGFFTLPALTSAGNLRLTGLGTLLLLIPWLFGSDAVILGTRVLNGLY